MRYEIEGEGVFDVPDGTTLQELDSYIKSTKKKSLPKRAASKSYEVLEGMGGLASQAITGLPSMATGGLAGLARLITTRSLSEAQKTQEGITGFLNEKLGYTPKTETGKKISNAFPLAMEILGSSKEGLVTPLHEKMFGKEAVRKMQQEREGLVSTLDSIANQVFPILGIAKKPPAPAAIPPRVRPGRQPKLKAKSQAKVEVGPPKPKQSPVVSEGPTLNAEQLAILDAFDDGPKHAAPEMRPNAKGTDVIFLDIDGVLNKSGAPGHSAYFEPDNIAALNELLDKRPGARIVVSSSWRKSSTIESLEEMLTKAGVRPRRVIGKTGNLGGDTVISDGVYKAPRGTEVAEWLQVHGSKVGKKVGVLVLDDRGDLGPFDKYQVKPIPNQGLTSEHIPGALETLSKEKPWQWVVNIEGKAKPLKRAFESAQGGSKPPKLQKQKVNPNTGKAVSPGPGAQAAGVNQAPPSITQLRNALAGVPRTTTATRMTYAQKIAGVGQIFKNKADAGLELLKAGGGGLWDAYTRAPVYTNFKGAFGDYLYARLKFQTEAHSFAKEFKTQVPDVAIREGMTNWIEAEGNEAVINQRLAHTKDPALGRGYRAALNLSPEQKTFAQNIKNYFDSMLDEAINAGILEDGVENYINHVWSNTLHGNKLRAQLNSGLLGTDPALIKKRVFATYFEGEQLGFIPKNKDAAFLVTAYDSAFKEMLAARTFVKSLTELKGKDGRPLAVVSGGGQTLPREAATPEAYLVNPDLHPKFYRKNPETGQREAVGNTSDYRRVDHPALRKWKWVDSADGKPIMLKGDLLLHPEITATFAERFQGKGYYAMQNLFGVSAIAKNPFGRLALRGLGEFKRTLLSLSGFHQVQVGIHAVFHNVSPFKPPPIDLNDAVVAKGVRNGLMVTDHSALAEFSEGVGGHSGLVAKIPGIGPAMQKYQEYLFQDYIPRLKVAMYKDAYERNLKRYPNLKDDQIAEITGHQANAAFGELNYKWLGRNKTFQDSLRVFFLAPDFLEARVKFPAQALSPYGKEQLAALVRGSAELWFGARIANYFLNDGDLKFDKPFSIVVGKKEYALRTIPGDMVHLFHDPRGFVYWRLNPGGVRPLLEWSTGLSPQGKERAGRVELWDFVKSGAPIPVQGFFKNGQDDLASRLLTSGLQSMGINAYISRSKAEQIAAEAAGANIPKGKETFESREQAKFIKGLRNAIDDEPTGVPKALQDALREERIKPSKAIDLLKERDLPPLERTFSRLSVHWQMNEIEEVFEAATEEEKAILRPIMRKKVANFFTSNRIPRAEKDRLRERLLPYLRGEK